jgi:hypothetical protein
MLICEIAAESTGVSSNWSNVLNSPSRYWNKSTRAPPANGYRFCAYTLPRARRHQTPPINKTFTSPSPLLATLTDGTGGALHQQPLLPDVCL